MALSRRMFTLNTRECFYFLEKGFILENEHGFQVWLECGKQVITNKKRMKRRRSAYSYKFDYPTWVAVGRISWWQRVKNVVCEFVKGLR